ncbi:MAG: phosphoglycerate mutase (2,3-diphosphoglycerate-independent) [Deltaproteobacteria bacterium GWA2_38_16]|nr:MAG: phosphoglycerate mutase (2,3-diphosphoglycerate-independent) [Deltaproteobacteria bacterium GWA2_38_16]OGQ03352.1 MAG: phosphoglycerate mutase (2,3-diphosphoglycerate-independent) [Deltaproteobacteria bacterium RIFCSPHIGHO2_02_FULL_38_15]HBQ20623.1 2,3-bisphosphoglycerate-independent phosphoglycerate mutase [Deltaproteobacteria bacterium]
MPKPNPVMLIVLDGFGINPKKEGNAIALASAPTFRKLETLNHSQIMTSGHSVGLPEGQMGNSEVGHTNIGAGRIVYQDLTRIHKSIDEGDFFKNAPLKKIFSLVKEKKSRLHLMGLVSDGGVHSHIEHLFALLKFAKKENINTVYLHCFLDGRDTLASISATYIQKLQEFIQKEKIGTIATLCGRYYAMDRDKRWDRIEKAYRALTEGVGFNFKNPIEAISAANSRGETDEFIQPSVINPKGTIQDNDAMLFFNFRADRARQLTRTFTENNFKEFKKIKSPKICHFLCMTRYDDTFNLPVIFPSARLIHILGQVLAEHHIPQLRIAETEKYAHVTFFFNGGEEKVFPQEKRILIPSPREVPTYDLKPEMSALEVTETVIDHLKKDEFGFILLNFANADMVGHTGKLTAAIKAVETLDHCIEKILQVISNKKGHLLITADHGNIEQMIDYKTLKPHTAHTTNPVPFYYVHPEQKKVPLNNGILADFMPTILNLMNLNVPKEVTGKNLIAG